AKTTYKTNRSNPLRFILSHISRYPFLAFTLVIGAFFNAALAALVPGLVGQTFNVIIDQRDLAAAVMPAFLIFLSQAIRAFVQFMRNISSEIYAQRIERDVRDELYASLLGKSMSFHDMQPVGEIMARVTNDVREMNLMMTPGVNLLVGSGMFLMMPVLFAPFIYPDLILVPLVFVLMQLTIQYRFVARLHPIAQEVRASFGQMNARLAETL